MFNSFCMFTRDYYAKYLIHLDPGMKAGINNHLLQTSSRQTFGRSVFRPKALVHCDEMGPDSTLWSDNHSNISSAITSYWWYMWSPIYHQLLSYCPLWSLLFVCLYPHLANAIFGILVIPSFKKYCAFFSSTLHPKCWWRVDTVTTISSSHLARFGCQACSNSLKSPSNLGHDCGDGKHHIQISYM